MRASCLPRPGVAVCAALSLALTPGCGSRGPQPDGSGTIECTEVQVAPLVAGAILSLPAVEGNVVARGAVLAQIATNDWSLRRAEAAAGAALARAQLDLLLAGARPEEIERAREQMREAEAAARAAQADAERVRKVFESRSATDKQMDDARAAAERADAVLGAARQNLARLQQGSRPEEIRAARSAADLAQARLAQAEKALADCTVYAPMNGTVTTRIREEGEYAATGTPLLTLSRLDEVWLSVYVPERRLGSVRVGQPARVRIDGDARWFDGRVTFVSPEAEFTPRNAQTPEERAKLVYRVKIALPNPDGTFKPGMPADGYLAAPQ
jgi:HlyD family secretion protein